MSKANTTARQYRQRTADAICCHYTDCNVGRAAAAARLAKLPPRVVTAASMERRAEKIRRARALGISEEREG